MAWMPKSVCRWSPRSITVAAAAAVYSRAPAPGRCTLTDGGNHSPRPRSFTCWRSHHTTSSVVVFPGVITSLENARAISAWTIRIRWRYVGSISGTRTDT